MGRSWSQDERTNQSGQGRDGDTEGVHLVCIELIRASENGSNPTQKFYVHHVSERSPETITKQGQQRALGPVARTMQSQHGQGISSKGHVLTSRHEAIAHLIPCIVICFGGVTRQNMTNVVHRRMSCFLPQFRKAPNILNNWRTTQCSSRESSNIGVLHA